MNIDWIWLLKQECEKLWINYEKINEADSEKINQLKINVSKKIYWHLENDWYEVISEDERHNVNISKYLNKSI